MTDVKRTYCVIGDPIRHSLSPKIHRYVFKSLNHKYSYTTHNVKVEELTSFTEASRKAGRPGWNVTIPHKQTILSFLDQIDEPARQIGAVNTVRNENGILTGFNTDVHGCRIALEKAGWHYGNYCVILGAGGAARAAIKAISEMGCKEVKLYDIAKHKAERLKTELTPSTNMKIHVGSLDSGDLHATLQDTDLLINATPIGMWPKTDISPVQSVKILHSQLTIFDMVYNPLETKLIQDGKKHGSKTVSGLHMLIGQALATDAIWLEQDIPDDFHDQIWNQLKQEMIHG